MRREDVKHRWWPLAAICLGSFLFLVDTTAVAVALPDIGERLDASLSALQWVVNGYTLVLAVLMLAAGSVADRHGHRTIFLAALGVFALASAVAALAPSAGVLIAARMLQGVGGAAIAVTTIALLGACYEGRARGVAIGVWAAVNGLAAAAGPMLGGLLTQTFGWRAIFAVNLPLAAVTATLTVRSIAPVAARASGRLDRAGIVVFALCAGGATYGLTQAGARGWGDASTLVALAIAAAALIAFVAVERGRPNPLLDLTLFRTPAFSVAMACAAASAIAFACLVYASIWLQATLGLGPIRAGLALVPLALSAFVTATLSGRLLHGVSARTALGTGLLVSALGCALQAQLDGASTAVALLPGLLVTGVGVGLIVPAMSGAVLAAAPPERAGMAVGAMTTFRQLGQTLGVAALGVLFQTRAHGAAGVDAGAAGGGRAVPAARAAVAHGLHDVYVAAAGFAAASGLLALLVLRERSAVPVSSSTR